MMTTTDTSAALARAVSALVRDHTVHDVLAELVADSRCTGATSVGLLVVAPGHDLELLVATSHAVAELELFQAREHVGPWYDTMTERRPVAETGAEAMRRRWDGLGERIVDVGFEAVRSFPLAWRDQALGALNLFFASPDDVVDDVGEAGQALADLATVVILHPDRLTSEQVTARVESALDGRAVIEQAKGVLAYRERISVDTAYDRLRALAAERGLTLTGTAQELLDEASRRLPTHDATSGADV